MAKHWSAQVNTAGGDTIRIYARWDGNHCDIITEKLKPETAGQWEEIGRKRVVVQVAERSFRKQFELISAHLTLPR